MNNDRLRKFMIVFAIVFGVVALLGTYVRNAYVQKNGPKQSFFGNGGDWKVETYDDGKVKSQGAMINGYQKDGDWTYYRQDGSIEAVETYKDGRLIKVVENGKVVDSIAAPKDTVKK